MPFTVGHDVSAFRKAPTKLATCVKLNTSMGGINVLQGVGRSPGEENPYRYVKPSRPVYSGALG